ncbi:UTP3 small subunit processome component Sas10 [Xylocopa sonorina]|uniref:UTP3 small subunit processome component Sas10 n=1 Tax=Xylocopa sonorina TaxID=1818115 RepID=UPI00403AC436
MEEEEARNIQKRLAEQLDDVDFGLDFIPSKKSGDQEVNEEVEQYIKTDFSKLSKRQRRMIIEKESPEFAALVNDFKDRMTEARDLVVPFLTLVKNSTLPYYPAVSFLRTKYHLLLNYCINITFYLMLKAKRLPVSSHPVIKRLAQYRELLNRLESEQGNLIENIQEILKAVKEGKLLYNTSNSTRIDASDIKDTPNDEKKFVGEIPSADSKLETGNGKFMEGIESANVETTDAKALSTENEEKRGITYQIAKNKGLTPCRKKEQRNPRVKHRNKYRKAKIRRKGAVRAVRKEVTRYAGEISGIKAGVKKSIKLK